MTWRLKRVKQCKKCPWKVSVNPHDIPNGYCETKHSNLKSTIAANGNPFHLGPAMACHETNASDETHCIGWLVNQLGPGNNIALRMKMISCENSGSIRLDGEQHRRFEDTLPSNQKRA